MIDYSRAGQPIQHNDLININKLISYYYTLKPEIGNLEHSVKFGTSGHRGSSERYNFNELHILAITQAIVEERFKNGITGPCYIGKDTHALSEPAFMSVLEVMIANDINVIIQENNGFTPTPAISKAILAYNRKNNRAKADGIIVTSSHNPPTDGGIKYNLPNGGPANIRYTKFIENRANILMTNNLKEIKRLSLNKAIASNYIKEQDLVQPFIEELPYVVNMKEIQKTGLKIGVDSLGGSGIEYWRRIAEYYKLDLTIINDQIDQTFSFLNLDKDGIIRIDCSSEFVVKKLISLRNNFDLVFTNDPDHDRHGIITNNGLMKPNNYLAVAINYLFQNRPKWGKNIAVGKTLTSSAIINQVVNNLNRNLIEFPTGFKWFVDGLYNGNFGFCCEDSGGASFLRFNADPWTTDKDGITMCLLAAEITSITSKNPQEYYNTLTTSFSKFSYNCLQISITPSQKIMLSKLTPNMIKNITLAGDPIINCINVGGLKVITKNGWFLARSSGTENIYKIYCESLIDDNHLKLIEEEAINIISEFLNLF